MSRTAARFTQADVARAIRAAKQTGASDVTIAPDGSIVIRFSPTPSSPDNGKAIDENVLIPL